MAIVNYVRTVYPEIFKGQNFNFQLFAINFPGTSSFNNEYYIKTKFQGFYFRGWGEIYKNFAPQKFPAIW